MTQPFKPSHCPYEDCESRLTETFEYSCFGRYRRKCDGRHIPRFSCHSCVRTFSTQTFRVDYRLKKPRLTEPIFNGLVSKVSLRKLAEALKVRRPTIERRLSLYGDHCRLYHAQKSQKQRQSGELCEGTWVFDELETFEHNRRFKPLTVAAIVHHDSFFIAGIAVGKMPARMAVNAARREERDAIAAAEGKRPSETKRVVTEALSWLAPDKSELHPRDEPGGLLRSDFKTGYPAIARAILPNHALHRTSSKDKRGPSNPLFAINHGFAMMRDTISRLVRRSWCASKHQKRLSQHLWVWVCFRNYVRDWKRTERDITSAEWHHMCHRQTIKRLLQWRIFEWRETGVPEGR